MAVWATDAAAAATATAGNTAAAITAYNYCHCY